VAAGRRLGRIAGWDESFPHRDSDSFRDGHLRTWSYNALLVDWPSALAGELGMICGVIGN
jgi:hypothetical protein